MNGTYMVSGSQTVSSEVEYVPNVDIVEGDNERETARVAAQKFFRDEGIYPEAVETNDAVYSVVGRCEGCERWLFENDQYVAHEDGIYTCPDGDQACDEICRATLMSERAMRRMKRGSSAEPPPR